MRIVFKFDLFDIVLWVRENVNNSSIYIDHTICAPEYSVTIQHGTFEGDIAMRQYKLLPSDVTMYKLLPSDVTMYKIRKQHMWGWHCHNTKIITLWRHIWRVLMCVAVWTCRRMIRGGWGRGGWRSSSPWQRVGSWLSRSRCLAQNCPVCAWSRFCHSSKMDNLYTS